MNMRHPSGESVGLIFDWAARLDRRRRLVVWLIVALLIHVGALVLLGHRAPQGITRLPDEATLYVINSQELSGLEAFVRAANPALFAPGQLREGLLESAQYPTYRPSFDTMEFKPLPLPREEIRVLPWVDARLMDALQSDATQPMARSKNVSRSPFRTQVRMSEALNARASSVHWSRTFAVVPEGDYLPSEFLVGVDGDGVVRHVFSRAPNRRAVESAAVMQDLFESRFEKSDPAAGLTWGTITVHWGEPEKNQP